MTNPLRPKESQAAARRPVPGPDAEERGAHRLPALAATLGAVALTLGLTSASLGARPRANAVRSCPATRVSLAGPATQPPIGSVVPALAFSTVSGQSFSLRDFASSKAIAFLFLSTQCPISNAYGGRIARLNARFAPEGVVFVAVDANRQESAAGFARYLKQRSLSLLCVKDTGNVVADRLGAQVTPEAVVLDRAGRICYRGRIDDQKNESRVTDHSLQNALTQVLAGRPVAHPEEPGLGCAITRLAPVRIHGTVTYCRDVAPILAARCESCHRAGESAPFSLTSYAQASAWAQPIKFYTQKRIMPPWRAKPHFGEFHDERWLNAKELKTLATWADEGAPEGNSKDLPPPPKFTDGWSLGKPDLVLQPNRPYHLAAEGSDVYRCFVLPTHFKHDRFVSALEVQPGNRAVVHHVIAFLDTKGQSLKLLGKDSEPGYTSFGGVGFSSDGMLGGWAPGHFERLLPAGIATRLPAGAYVVMQVHYHKNGVAQTDRSRLGLYFARAPVDKTVRIAAAVNDKFVLQPGNADQEVRASWTVPQDIHVLSVIPHMHLLGRDMKMQATLPDGEVKPLVWVPDWDFNWQEVYSFKQPLALPKGTRVDLVAHYDNSAGNPKNPNRPPKAVRWGEQTTDEMCIGFLGYTRDSQHLLQASAPAGPPVQVAGTWQMDLKGPNGVRHTVLTLRQTGAQLDGTLSGARGATPVTGHVTGGEVGLTFALGGPSHSLTIKCHGQLAPGGTALTGSYDAGAWYTSSWSAKRGPVHPVGVNLGHPSSASESHVIATTPAGASAERDRK